MSGGSERASTLRAPRLGTLIFGKDLGKKIDHAADRHRGDIAGAVGAALGSVKGGTTGAVIGEAAAKKIVGDNIVREGEGGCTVM